VPTVYHGSEDGRRFKITPNAAVLEQPANGVRGLLLQWCRHRRLDEREIADRNERLIVRDPEQPPASHCAEHWELEDAGHCGLGMALRYDRGALSDEERGTVLHSAAPRIANRFRLVAVEGECALR